MSFVKQRSIFLLLFSYLWIIVWTGYNFMICDIFKMLSIWGFSILYCSFHKLLC